MNEEKKSLLVVRDLKKEMVVIDGNYNGLLSLKAHIESLLNIKKEYLKNSNNANADLMTPEWGGEELNEKEIDSEDWTLVRHLRIYRREEE